MSNPKLVHHLLLQRLYLGSKDVPAIRFVYTEQLNTLSKLEALSSNVFCPHNTVPCPGKLTTGLMPFLYRKSRAAWTGLKANLIIFLICPLSNPALAHHEALSEFTALLSPATSPDRFTHLFLSLYLVLFSIVRYSIPKVSVDKF